MMGNQATHGLGALFVPAKTVTQPSPDQQLTETVEDQITEHVARLLALVEDRTGGVPEGEWWDHALALTGRSPFTTTATLNLSRDEPAHELPAVADNDIDLTEIWRVVWALGSLVVVVLAALLLASAIALS